MFKIIFKFIYFKIKYRKHKLKIKSLNVPLSSKFGYFNTLESGVYVDGMFELGDFSYVNKNTFLTNVKIGKFTSISSNCNIGGFEHPINYYTTHPIIFSRYYGAEKIIKIDVKKTIIGNDVWIGHGAILKQGITVCDGAVIAAGAIVTKDVPPYEVWAGTPAKKIKTRIVTNFPYGRDDWWDIEVKRIQSWKKY
ncbi:CatB-related O-acetyltransferase [Shewanella algae]|uniref:CatB-related O-acetyltransferase n=1 Tax=Shewanella algae TaxID=38313 RepID=UPI001AAFE74E|nr:CatB-related O-acetyltransferase [Shewanella algae]MBO2550342.1 CatB-related O-acetyltransferase [Shewanella algae]